MVETDRGFSARMVGESKPPQDDYYRGKVASLQLAAYIIEGVIDIAEAEEKMRDTESKLDHLDKLR